MLQTTRPMSHSRKQRLQTLTVPLNALYARFNQRQFVYPDPLAPLYDFSDPGDQEVVGLITATLAFGNVKQILKSIDVVLQNFPDPARSLKDMPNRIILKRLTGFRHRYVAEQEMASLLAGIREALREHDAIGHCFGALDDSHTPTIVPTLTRFVHFLQHHGTVEKNYLLPDPDRGSACKRWFMYLRWMVRQDDVDLGHWAHLGAHRLVIPVDTHMQRVARGMYLSRRKAADLKTALEITEAFRVICPEDPVRYDFCLTRLGIRDDGDMDGFLKSLKTR